MSSGGLTNAWQDHRPKIVWATVVVVSSVLLVGGAFFLYELLVTPPEPDLQAAAPQEVARFVSDRRGWSKFSVAKRKEWLVQMVMAYQDPSRRDALASAFRGLPVSDRRVFVDSFFEVARPEVMAAAREYNKLPPRQRDKFLRDKLSSYDTLAISLQDFAQPFGAALPSNSPGWTKMLVEKTSPGDRALAGPYVEGLSALARSLRGGESRRRHGGGGTRRADAGRSRTHRN